MRDGRHLVMNQGPRRIAALALAIAIVLPATHAAALDADRFAVPSDADLAHDAQLAVVDATG